MDIPGPAGALEARLDLSSQQDADTSRFAVLSHPHPQYGGSMHDAVLDTLAGALLAAGVSTLRFNFRGVGGSEGVSSGGAEEADDLMAAVAWLQAEQHPQTLWLGGYSFGASMVWRAAANTAAERILLVAPPVGLMDFTAQNLDAQIDVFAGDQDDYVDFDRLSSLRGATVHALAGADHFFMGAHEQLRQQISKAISR